MLVGKERVLPSANSSIDFTATTEVSSKHHFSNVAKLMEDKSRLKLKKEINRSRRDYKDAFNQFV